MYTTESTCVMKPDFKHLMMTILAVLSLTIGIVGATGDAWLVPAGDDAEDIEANDGNYDYGIGLRNYWSTNDFGNATTCESYKGMVESPEFQGNVECDGSIATDTFPLSVLCDKDLVEFACATETGGLIGMIGIWLGIICAFVLTSSLVLPMAGVDALENLPKMVKTITTWGTGLFMLAGILGWFLMILSSETLQDLGLGTSFWLAGAAMTMGLGAAVSGQFLKSEVEQ